MMSIELPLAALALFIFKPAPEFRMRFIVWMLIHSVYRVAKTGLENIPDEGAGVIACNHVSFVEALVIAAARMNIAGLQARVLALRGQRK